MVTGSTLRLTASLAALVLATPAMAATFPLANTGVNGSGTPLASGTPDSNYQVISSPLGAFTPTAYNSTFGGIPGFGANFPFTTWLPDDTLSNWISLPTMGFAPAGIFDYRVTFSLSGLDAASAAIIGRLAADDWLNDVLINGVSTGISAGVNNFASGAYANWTDFSINNGFVSGTNTLDFMVNNYFGNSVSGLRVEMTGTANTLSAVPEPANWAMMILGLGLAGAALRRQRQQISAKVSFT